MKTHVPVQVFAHEPGGHQSIRHELLAESFQACNHLVNRRATQTSGDGEHISLRIGTPQLEYAQIHQLNQELEGAAVVSRFLIEPPHQMQANQQRVEGCRQVLHHKQHVTVSVCSRGFDQCLQTTEKSCQVCGVGLNEGTQLGGVGAQLLQCGLQKAFQHRFGRCAVISTRFDTIRTRVKSEVVIAQNIVFAE